MKQCNYCSADCRPSKPVVMSDEECSKFKPIDRTWKLRHVVSKVTVTDEGINSDALKWLVGWT